MQKEIDKTGEDMLYLITCALHNQTPDKDKVCGMDIAALYRYARRHTLAAITYDALELLGGSTGDGLLALKRFNKQLQVFETEKSEFIGQNNISSKS